MCLNTRTVVMVSRWRVSVTTCTRFRVGANSCCCCRRTYIADGKVKGTQAQEKTRSCAAQQHGKRETNIGLLLLLINTGTKYSVEKIGECAIFVRTRRTYVDYPRRSKQSPTNITKNKMTIDGPAGVAA